MAVGNYGERETGQAILDGELRPVLNTGFQRHIQFLACFNLLTHRRKVSPLVTSGNFKSFCAKWKENTSTSPSGKHLGHYKALLSPAFMDNNELTESANCIIDVYVALLNIAATYGSPWEGWQLQAQQAEDDPPLQSGLQLADWNDLWSANDTWHGNTRPSTQRTMGITS